MQKSKPVYHKVAVVYNRDKEPARKEWRRLERWLKARHLTVISGINVTAGMKQADFIVVLGGDGTVLRAARAVASWNIPVLGINLGRLGFLAATEVDANYRTLARILDGQGRVENRSMLSVTATVSGTRQGPYLALNECVIRSKATGRILVLRANSQNRYLTTYVGDGLIISTPTGSTAYNLSASGPIIHPEVEVILLNPICPHSLFQRPLVVPSSETIAITVEGPNLSALLSLDGQMNHTLSPGDVVEIRQGTARIPLLMDPHSSFYQVLQAKLQWGGANDRRRVR